MPSARQRAHSEYLVYHVGTFPSSRREPFAWYTLVDKPHKVRRFCPDRWLYVKAFREPEHIWLGQEEELRLLELEKKQAAEKNRRQQTKKNALDAVHGKRKSQTDAQGGPKKKQKLAAIEDIQVLTRMYIWK